MAGFNLGDIFVTFKAKTDGLDSAIKGLKDKMDQVDDATQKVGGSMTKMGAVIGAVSGVISTVFNKAVQLVTNTIGDAIKRVDTLNNSSRAFENMGFKVQDTKKAMDALDKSIRGLPTSLDSAVRGMTLIAASTNDVQKSQKVWSALNDAILGFGGSTAMVDNATVQLSQDLAGGRITAQTWLSLLNSGMGPALNAIARQMGITTSALKDGLGEGTISVDQFTDALINLDTNGGGGMKSLQKIAKDSTSGISTGFQNAQTAITRGIAEIIKAVGSGNISGSIAKIGDAAEKMFKGVAGVINFIKDNKDVFTSLAVAITPATTAMIAFNAAMAVQKLIGAFVVIQTLGVAAFLQLENAGRLVAAAQWAINAAMSANPIAIIVLAVIALVAGLAYFFTQTKTGQAIMKAFFKIISDGFNDFVGWLTQVGKSVADFAAGVGGFFSDLWKGITAGFDAFVQFLRAWGPTILAIIFWPFSLALGLILANWGGISGFFTDLWNGIVAVWSGVVGFFAGVIQGIMDVFAPIVGFIAGLYIAEWNAIVAVWNGAIGFFSDLWQGIVTIFTPVANFFGGVFQGAWNFITGLFGGLAGFFTGVWNNIVKIFTGVGTSVGNAIGGAVRGVLNSVLGGAVSIINGFIGTINNVTGIINKIPGVHVPKIGTLGIPRFSTGVENFAGGLAYVHAGELLVNMAPGTSVIPKKKVDQMGGGVNVYGDVNIDSQSDADYFFQRVDRNAKLENMGLSPAL